MNALAPILSAGDKVNPGVLGIIVTGMRDEIGADRRLSSGLLLFDAVTLDKLKDAHFHSSLTR